MSTGSRPNPSGKKTGVPHATYLQVKNGASAAGYKAGILHGVYGHRTHAHQPCCRIITEGELQCPYCLGGLDPVWRGYLPVWDRDWALRYVLIGEDYCETVDVIGHREQVVITRAKNPISPLVVRQDVTLDRELPNKAPWSEKIDMEAICLELWKDAPLKEWVYTHRAKKPKPEPKPALRSNGKPFSPPMQAAAKKYATPEGVHDAAEEFEQARNRLAKRAAELPPSKNGTHD